MGLRATLIIGAIGIAFTWLWLVWSPLRRLRELPKYIDTEAAAPVREQARAVPETEALPGTREDAHGVSEIRS